MSVKGMKMVAAIFEQMQQAGIELSGMAAKAKPFDKADQCYSQVLHAMKEAGKHKFMEAMKQEKK